MFRPLLYTERTFSPDHGGDKPREGPVHHRSSRRDTLEFIASLKEDDNVSTPVVED